MDNNEELEAWILKAKGKEEKIRSTVCKGKFVGIERKESKEKNRKDYIERGKDGLYTVSGLNFCQSMPGMSENPQMMICRMLSRTARVVLVRDFVTVTPEKGIGLNRKFVHKKLRVMKYVTIDAMDLC